MSVSKPILVIIVPCYNEEEVLPVTSEKLLEKISSLSAEGRVSAKSALLFVDDRSSDNTWALIEKFHRENPLVFKGIKLSANRGHQNALLCGLLSVKDYADVTVSIDADLQDDINAIDRMLESFFAGAEIVFGVPSGRRADGLGKKICAGFFYKIMRFLGGGLVDGHADFRLMSKKAIDALAEYNEVNLFLRGIVPMLGFKTDTAHYSRTLRPAGKSKYPFSKMLDFALEGITSFSIKPMRFIILLGVLLFTVSLGMAVFFCVRHFSGLAVNAWAGFSCSIWASAGLIIFSIGIAGEYIGKIYLETKRRPRYHIEKILFENEP